MEIGGRTLPHAAQGSAGVFFLEGILLVHIKDLNNVPMLCPVHSISRNRFYGNSQLYVQFYLPGFYCKVIIRKQQQSPTPKSVSNNRRCFIDRRIDKEDVVYISVELTQP